MNHGRALGFDETGCFSRGTAACENANHKNSKKEEVSEKSNEERAALRCEGDLRSGSL